MPLLSGSSDEVLRENVKELMRAGHREDQAYAIALQKQREAVQGEAGGDSPLAAAARKAKAGHDKGYADVEEVPIDGEPKHWANHNPMVKSKPLDQPKPARPGGTPEHFYSDEATAFSRQGMSESVREAMAEGEKPRKAEPPKARKPSSDEIPMKVGPRKKPSGAGGSAPR